MGKLVSFWIIQKTLQYDLLFLPFQLVLPLNASKQLEEYHKSLFGKVVHSHPYYNSWRLEYFILWRLIIQYISNGVPFSFDLLQIKRKKHVPCSDEKCGWQCGEWGEVQLTQHYFACTIPVLSTILLLGKAEQLTWLEKGRHVCWTQNYELTLFLDKLARLTVIWITIHE